MPQAGAAIVVLVGGAVLGLIAGLVWTRIADHVRIVITANGPDLVSYETDQFFSADGMFALIGVVAGLAVGTAAFCWRRHRGVIVLLGAGLGAFAGALVAWQLDRQLGLAHYHQLLHSTGVGRRFDKPIDLRAKAALGVWPLAAVVAYTMMTLLSRGEVATRRGRGQHERG